MRALVADSSGELSKLKIVNDRAQPKPTDHASSSSPMVVIKVHSAALNPADWKMMSWGMMVESWPYCFGCDCAGTVADSGEDSEWTKGDRVWGFTELGKPWSGTLAEYAMIPSDLVGYLPGDVSYDDGCTLGVGGLTAAMGLWYYLGLSLTPAEAHSTTPVLVYGASSSTGQFAVQLAKISGYTVLAVASKKHHDFITSKLGADQAFDYHDDDWIDQVVSANKDIALVFDSIGGPATLQCADLLQRAGHGDSGVIATTTPAAMLGDDEKNSAVKIHGLFVGTGYHEHRSELNLYIKTLSGWLAEGKLRPNPTRVVGGLDSAVAALEEMKAGKVSGEKLVVHV